MSHEWDAGACHKSRLWRSQSDHSSPKKRTDVHLQPGANFCFSFSFVPSIPHLEVGGGMRWRLCQPVRITFGHVLWLRRTGGSRRNRWEDGEALRGAPDLANTLREMGCGEERTVLTQNQTPCGKTGTCCSLGRRRRGRRRSRWQTWISGGTACGPPCLTGRPRRRRRTSSPDKRCCLETQRQRRSGEQSQ